MHKLPILLVSGWLLIGCSSNGELKVPDYYDQQLVKKHYPVGQTIEIDQLKCSQNFDKCQGSAASRKWVQRNQRQYQKAFYFE